MCVQLAGTEDLNTIAVRFSARRTMADDDVGTKASLRPTDRVPSLIATATERRLGWMAWGWRETMSRESTADVTVKKSAKPTLLLHARFETAMHKPMWAESFTSRRCVIVSKGWWEVQAQPGRTRGIPYFYCAPSEPLLALAALWRREGDDIRFTMLTTEPTPALASIHDRLPVVFNDDDLTQWLNPKSDPRTLSQLGKLPGHELTAWETSKLGEQQPA